MAGFLASQMRGAPASARAVAVLRRFEDLQARRRAKQQERQRKGIQWHLHRLVGHLCESAKVTEVQAVELIGDELKHVKAEFAAPGSDQRGAEE